MAFLPEAEWPQKRARLSWSPSDAIIYALGLGFGDEPDDPHSLSYVYEREQRVMPTVVTALARTMVPIVGELGGDHSMAVHAEHAAIFHRPIPAQGAVEVIGSVTEIVGRGPGRGAYLNTRATLVDERLGVLAEIDSSVLARGDDHPLSERNGKQPDAAPAQGPPSATWSLPVPRGLAAVYRLSGDLNPLHIDMEAARKVGFPRPILHGLCTYGLACRAVIETHAAGRPDLILGHRARFLAPFYAGETLRVEMWDEGRTVHFDAWSHDRQVKVLAGRTELRVTATAPETGAA